MDSFIQGLRLFSYWMLQKAALSTRIPFSRHKRPLIIEPNNCGRNVGLQYIFLKYSYMLSKVWDFRMTKMRGSDVPGVSWGKVIESRFLNFQFINRQWALKKASKRTNLNWNRKIFKVKIILWIWVWFRYFYWNFWI